LALLAADVIALAAPASAQAPGMVPGVHDVHLKGIGKVRFGMTVKQARDAAGVHMTKSRVNECTYLDAGPPGTGQGPTLMPLDPRHHSALDAVVDLEDEAALAAALPAEVEAARGADVDRALAAWVEAGVRLI
jgi:hypothetical protein